jgi:hypothetical protein
MREGFPRRRVSNRWAQPSAVWLMRSPSHM